MEPLLRQECNLNISANLTLQNMTHQDMNTKYLREIIFLDTQIWLKTL